MQSRTSLRCACRPPAIVGGRFVFTGYNDMMQIIMQGALATPTTEIVWLVMEAVSSDAPPDCHAAWLSVDEAAACRALKTVKRRHDWLRGRFASKTLLQQLVLTQMGRDMSLDQIQLLSRTDGRPQVTFLTPDDDLPHFTLSLSHSQARAFCAAVSRREAILGADMEYIEPRSDAFVRDYFTTAEQELIEATDNSELATIANAIWSGKESALKAIGRGLAEDTRCVTCLPQAAAGDFEWRSLAFRWERGQWPKLRGWWVTVGEYVLTLATGD